MNEDDIRPPDATTRMFDAVEAGKEFVIRNGSGNTAVIVNWNRYRALMGDLEAAR